MAEHGEDMVKTRMKLHMKKTILFVWRRSRNNKTLEEADVFLPEGEDFDSMW